MTRRALLCAVSIAVALGAVGSGAGMAAPEAVVRVLRAAGGFSPADLARVERGEPVAKVLDTDRREVAVVGAVRINGSRDRWFARYRDLSNLKSPIILQLGAFGRPPRPDDLRDLAFETYDLETIAACDPGDCGVRLSAEQMARFRREVDWTAADWRTKAEPLWRQLLAEYAAGYVSSGSLGDYRNKATPLSVAAEFGELFRKSSDLEAEAPELFAYLQRYPHAALQGSDDRLYWSKENFGLRPVTSITHLTLYAPGDRPWWIATKQIYATHYFDAQLGLTIAYPDAGGGFYLVSVNRARTRSLVSFTRTLVRSQVQRRSREGLLSVLSATKLALER